MFQSTTGLPHLLAPQAYYAPEIYRNELDSVMRSAWHLVGTLNDLSKPGDFLTVTIADKEIQVRNFDGHLKAYSNVCAHRHSLLTSRSCGNTPQMRCQYHGWEYGPDGFTRKIPCAKDFAPIDRNELRLTEYRLDSIGQLIFVSWMTDGPNLADYLGPIAATVAERFGEDWRRFYKGQFEYAANWKVAIENSLEAYHVESIHPNTFRNAPNEERSEHQIHDRHTSFSTDMPFAAHHPVDQWFQKSETWMVKRLGRTPSNRYQQHHVFPNLLFSFTDAISLVHYVQPVSPTNSRSLLYQFGAYPKIAKRWQKLLAKGLGNVETTILKRIMNEDLAMYPVIQRGLQASSHRGVLARSEERIYAFQAYLAKAMQEHAFKVIPGLNS